MKIEVKNIKINLTFSQETIMFMANVYINGKKTFYCQNEGFGGSTSIHGFDGWNEQTYQEANEYLKPQGFDSLVDYVDDIIYKEADRKEKEKYDKRMAKEMSKGLIISKNNLQNYQIVSWRNKSLSEVLQTQSGCQAVMREVAKVKAEGYTIYNTNLPQYILN